MVDVSAPQEDPHRGLANQIVTSAKMLLLRQVAGAAVSLCGMLLLTRVIGPSNYGLYASAFGIMFFIQTAAEFNLDVYLVRYPGEMPPAVADQVFTLLLISALLGTVVAFVSVPALSIFINAKGFSSAAFLLVSGIPMIHLQQVPLSLLERRLDYKRIGITEILGQVSFYVLAIPCALEGGGVLSPILGWWGQQAVLLIGYWHYGHYTPRLILKWDLIKHALEFGIASTTSTMAYATRNLVVPVFINHIVGVSAVGILSLALRLIDQCGFLGQAVLRMSITLLAKVAHDRGRLQRAMTLGSQLQLLVVGVPLVVLSAGSGWLVPLVFGAAWKPVSAVIPLLAPPTLALACFGVQNAVLLSRARPWTLVISQSTSSVLLWLFSLLLVPKFGISGFAFSECLAMASWIVTDIVLARHFPRPNRGILLFWWSGLSATALAPALNWWLIMVAPLVFLVSTSRRTIIQLAMSFRET